MPTKDAFFISIDDIEFHNLRNMLDEIFGDGKPGEPEANFVGAFVWRKSRKAKTRVPRPAYRLTTNIFFATGRRLNLGCSEQRRIVPSSLIPTTMKGATGVARIWSESRAGLVVQIFTIPLRLARFLTA